MTEPRFRPDEIVIACALRFDGHKYIEETGFDVDAAIDEYMETETWDCPDKEKLCAFFILQRCLCKWSLVYEPYHGHYWRIFRQMFFEVVDLEIPAGYEVEWNSKWDDDYAWQCKKAIASVRRKHQRTKYDDNAKRQP